MRPRLTKRVRDGLNELATIGETVIETGGEGWGLECTRGEDYSPCNRPNCEICVAMENLRRACAYARHLANKT